MQQADVPDALAARPAAPTPTPPRSRRSRVPEVVAFVLVGVLLIAATAAAFLSLHRSFWSASAFVERYVQLLADGRAADALAIDGVGVDSEELQDADLPVYAHEALLRSAALSDAITEVRAVGEQVNGDITQVTVSYRIGGDLGETTFDVRQTGWSGLVPSWQFASSPLTVMNVSVQGSWRFSVNGFEVDKRQVSADGVDADPEAAIPMLAFVPMAYEIAVDTAATVAPPMRVDATAPLTLVEADVASVPSEEFAKVVTEEAEAWLAEGCGERHVLQPDDCPYGYRLENRLAPGTQPTWSITEFPEIELEPHGAWWSIKRADGVAHIEMEVQSIVDGSISQVSEDILFTIDGTVELLEDGSARIQIGAPLLRR